MKKLLCKPRYVKLVRLPICGGISPENPFVPKFRWFIFVERWPIEKGKRPIRLLKDKSIRPRLEQLIRAVRMGKVMVLPLTS